MEATKSKLQEAQEQTVFVIDYTNEPCVEKTDLAEFLGRFADETTTPRGVGRRYFMREREDVVLRIETDKDNGQQRVYVEDRSDVYSKSSWRFESFVKGLSKSELSENWEDVTNAPWADYEVEDEDYTYQYFCGSVWEAMTWGVGGNSLASLEEYFLTEKEAEDKEFEWLEHDYESDDNSESYFETEKEAEAYLQERMGE